MKIVSMALCCVIVGAGLAPPVRAEHSNSALEARVQRIEDQQEIQRLLYEYGRTLDHGDYAAYGKLFAKDGEWVGAGGSYKGPAAIEAGIGKSMSAPSFAPLKVGGFHLLTNAIIDVNGDHATAVSKWSYVHIVDKAPVVAFSGRYHDVLVRENGHWRFQRRVVVSATDPDPT